MAGTHYVCEQVSGGTVSYDVSPSANGSGQSAFQVTGTVFPIQLTLKGPPVAYPGQLAVGQLLTATVTTYGSGLGDTFTWGTPGDKPFAGYSPSASGCAAATAYTTPPNTSANMSCYFGGIGATTITCSYYCGALGQTIPLSANLNLLGPDISGGTGTFATGGMGLISTTGGPPWSAFLLTGVTWGSYQAGIFEVHTMKDPFILATGSGTWGYVQTKDRTSVVNGISNSAKGLDLAFPYTDFSTGLTQFIPADQKAVGHFADKPGITASRRIPG